MNVLSSMTAAGWVAESGPLKRRDWWKEARRLTSLRHPEVPAVILVRTTRRGRMHGVMTYSYLSPEPDTYLLSVQTSDEHSAVELAMTVPRTAADAGLVPRTRVRAN